MLSADQIVEQIQKDLRAFVGATSFEELCRQWVISEGKSGNLPFSPIAVGSHWSRRIQVDVVAINWESKEILLGECKWGTDKIDRQVARELIDKKTSLMLLDLPQMGHGWKVHHVLFGRKGFTDAANTEMKKVGGLCVDLKQIDQALNP